MKGKEKEKKNVKVAEIPRLYLQLYRNLQDIYLKRETYLPVLNLKCLYVISYNRIVIITGNIQIIYH